MRVWMRLAASLLTIALTAGVAFADVRPRDRRGARDAARYLRSVQNDDGSYQGFSPIGSTADAVLALVAVRREPQSIEDALDYLIGNSAEVDKLGEIANVVLALVAGGRDPRSFDGRDLVAEIDATQQASGQYMSDPNDNSGVYDHALSVLALAAADAPISGQARNWLLDAQCGDGGWQFDKPSTEADNNRCFDGTETDFTKSDTNTAALAIQALEVAPGAAAPDVGPFRFLRKIRDDIKRGWGYSYGFTLTDANSTALVLRAYAAAGRKVPKGAKNALLKLRHGVCANEPGSFSFTWSDENGDGRYTKAERTDPDTGATIAAIPGLLEKPLPPAHVEVTKSVGPIICD